ncbi:hypothetical protein P3L10_027944 [Capsicum annuum]
MDENEMSIEIIDRNNELQVIEQILEAKIAKPSKIKRVTTYEKAHSCSVDFITFDHRNATSKVICDYILELVHDSSNVIIPTFMVDEMRRKYEIIISYNKEWQAIQHAYKVIRGTAEENYNRLPSYLHMKKENNPKMYTNIKRDDENRYKCYTIDIDNFYPRGNSLSFICTD